MKFLIAFSAFLLVACNESQISTGARQIYGEPSSSGVTPAQMQQIEAALDRQVLDSSRSSLTDSQREYMRQRLIEQEGRGYRSRQLTNRYRVSSKVGAKLNAGLSAVAAGDLRGLNKMGLSKGAIAYASFNGRLAPQDLRAVSSSLGISYDQAERLSSQVIRDLR